MSEATDHLSPESELRRLHDLLRSDWLQLGLPDDQARLHADRALQVLCQHFGGRKLYVQSNKAQERARRDAAICALWNGRNTRELCAEYEISESRLRQIVDSPRGE